MKKQGDNRASYRRKLVVSVIGGVAILVVACTSGVPQAEFDSLKGQFGERDATATQLQAELERSQGQLVSLTKPFKEWVQNWERRAAAGPQKSVFEVKNLKAYQPSGARVINAQPGDLYVYVNTGNQNWGPKELQLNTNKFSRVNIINARTKQLIATSEMTDGPGRSHFSAVTPDGRYAYVSGGASVDDAVLWKVDAVTLEPVKKLNVGGTLHHMVVFRDRYMLVNTFNVVEGGVNVFLLDPETDQMVGGIKPEALGGRPYNVFADPQERYIYMLVEPDGAPGFGGLIQGVMAQPTFWVAKVDPDTWQVVREYPYPGWRSDWIAFSPNGKFMYINGYLDDTVSKISLETGELAWRADTGPGPYGIEVTADGKEVWVADKGEASKAHKGRTVTVIDDEKGTYKDTIITGRGTDHLILSPDGKEMWASSNDSSAVYVFDVASHKVIAEIAMPQGGDAHGVVFVHYDAAGRARVVADQGDFHGGVDPRNGRALVLR